MMIINDNNTNISLHMNLRVLIVTDTYMNAVNAMYTNISMAQKNTRRNRMDKKLFICRAVLK